ncbi:hypothetical protein AtA6_11090 [Agrobacterium tumefaciens]|nr:hypothetical protein Ach5_14090 [Agrobacterium tumefaciens]AYM67326.1 hypothetical protein AtA6_11090 [Agrobacterium tumefaciens]
MVTNTLEKKLIALFKAGSSPTSGMSALIPPITPMIVNTAKPYPSTCLT